MGKTSKIDMSKIVCEKYYYYRNQDGDPNVCVCVIKDENGLVHRGISIVSPIESRKRVNKKRGRAMAKGRALKAYYRQESCLPITRVSLLKEICIGFPIEVMPHRSHFNCLITEYEKGLLDGGKSKNEN